MADAPAKGGPRARPEPWVYGAIFAGLVLVPAVLSLVTAQVAFERSKSTEFCASCHVMKPYAEDLKNPDSDLLAAKHYQYRRINHNQCYACHTDYDFLGPVNAKIRGMRHVAAYYFGSGEKPLALYKPFKNSSCLQCHEGAKSFVQAAAHQGMLEELRSGEMDCVACHGPVHPSRQ